MSGNVRCWLCYDDADDHDEDIEPVTVSIPSVSIDLAVTDGRREEKSEGQTKRL